MRRLSPLATVSDHAAVDRPAAIDAALVRAVCRNARANPRLREIHRFHADDEAPLQRMLNAIQPGSYVRPHRHLDPPKDEGFLILSGRCGVVTFDDAGAVVERLVLDRAAHSLGCDIPAGVWHSLVALATDTCLYEVKPGPYAAASDKDFPAWAPAADDAEAAAYLAGLERAFDSR